jgi:molybdenum cofactor synthesis domain-containing protein
MSLDAPINVDTIAILVVGDEILRGQVRDANAHYMATRLCGVGLDLRRVEIVGDRVADISEATARLSAAHDHLVACGGVGPTHDDVTMEGVARAFETPLTANAELEALIKSWKGEDLDHTWQRMARIPEQAELLTVPDHFPIVRMKNVFILPGVPRILQAKFEVILTLLGHNSHPCHTRSFLYCGSEFHIAEPLKSLSMEVSPVVQVGSYPKKLGPRKYQVEVTLTSRDREALRRACLRLPELIPEAEPRPRRADPS